MDIEFDVFRKIVVDDMGDALDIDAPGGKVGCDEDGKVAGAEFFHDAVAFALGKVGVNGVGIDAFAHQHAGEVVTDAFEPAEDQGQAGLFVCEQVREERLLVPRLDGEVELLDEACGERAGAGDDLLGVGHEAACEFFDLVGDCRRDEDGLALLWAESQDVLDVLAEAHIEHAVDFVEDDELEVAEAEVASALHVHDPAGRADDDLGALVEFVGLCCDFLAAVDGD